MSKGNYFLGLDVGTDSVGYAVTDDRYNLLKYNGEPMWGSHVFEAASQAAERRAFRTSRRRTNRKKMRAALVNEIFAEEIAKVDERFFIRRQESALFREDVSADDRYIVFNDEDFNDRTYYSKYPTIHHLICELMNSKEPHDIRLVYIAVAYLVAHRGHFLSEVDKNNIDGILDFRELYSKFLDILKDYDELLQWGQYEDGIKKIILEKGTVRAKEEKFLELLNQGKKFKEQEDDMVSKAAIIKLLSGGTIEVDKLFPYIALTEKLSVSFRKGEEEFNAVLSELDEEADLLVALRNVYDWGTLADVLDGEKSISAGKVRKYNQHKTDLKNLKYIIRKYLPEEYYSVFRDGNNPTNYAAYSYNYNSGERIEKNVKSKAGKEAFCDYISKLIKDIDVAESDLELIEDMKSRLASYAFMPKQVEGDNRVIPYQLYYHELKVLLENANGYLKFLNEADSQGYTPVQKLLSIMEFRIPYYVGPLRKDNGTHAWIERKAEGKIYPWNFEDKVDLDKSEEAFIKKMTNKCTYLPDENVLPKNSLIYGKFCVLNEINNIRVNTQELSIEQKQGVYELFKNRKKVTVKLITSHMRAEGILQESDVLSGIDIEIKSSLKSYHDFKRMLENGILNENQVENIIERLTYSEDRNRIVKWIKEEYPSVSDEDVKYISKLKYADFGRLSRKFLTELRGSGDGVVDSTILEAMWNTNNNLMQLLSERYNYNSQIEEYRNECYGKNDRSITDMLDEMYVPNAVRRSIYRTLAITNEVRKACGGFPKKVFVEMARGGGKKGERSVNRRNQIQELYKNVANIQKKELQAELDDKSDNELQGEVLFLYFMQLGKCAYSGDSISINDLKSGHYNVDHIYPQAYVKDDSLNNKVLVKSELNAKKGDIYPINSSVREKMSSFWYELTKMKLMSEEKYHRLTRSNSFTDEEKMGFINRQLVETRQSTKAITAILSKQFPDAEIIYSKAGLVSDFRKEFDRLKCRSVNDNHHAKDAYLNIVVGNVYNCRFTKKFYVEQKYSMKTKTLFLYPVYDGEKVAWNGVDDLSKVKSVILKNNIHYTRFALRKKGGLFDQMPMMAAEGLIPRKRGLDTAKYGGYRKPAATCFLLVKYQEKGKAEACIIPVELMAYEKVLNDMQSATKYAKKTLEQIWGKSDGQITDIEFPIGLRELKVNTVISFDGFRACIRGKDSGGKCILLTSMMPLTLSNDWELYIKRLEAFEEKKKLNKNIVHQGKYDGISKECNAELYDILAAKVINGPYKIPFAAVIDTLVQGHDKFMELDIETQIKVLNQMVLLLKCGRAGNCDLSGIGGAKNTGTYKMSSKISSMRKYEKVELIDVSASGIYEKKIVNLLDIL